jgi:hypothetical protein
LIKLSLSPDPFLSVRTTISAIIGGTVSEVTGGKFANGAVTGAFVHMFNAEMGNILSKINQMHKIENMKNDKFREIMGFDGTDNDIWVVKTKLEVDIRNNSILDDFPRLIRNGIKMAFSITPNSFPMKLKDTFISFGDYAGFFDTSSDLSYIYNCKSLGNCNVSIVKNK